MVEGTVTDEDQAEDQLRKPGLGDGEVEEDALLIGGCREGQLEAGVGFAQLLIDELAADVVLQGDLGDRHAGKGGQGQLLARRPIQQGCGAGGGLPWG
jgi:hypothetical protein